MWQKCCIYQWKLLHVTYINNIYLQPYSIKIRPGSRFVQEPRGYFFSCANRSANHSWRFKNDSVLRRPWNEKVNSSVDIALYSKKEGILLQRISSMKKHWYCQSLQLLFNIWTILSLEDKIISKDHVDSLSVLTIESLKNWYPLWQLADCILSWRPINLIGRLQKIHNR